MAKINKSDILFIFAILIVAIISFLINDRLSAIISSIFGIIYTILIGKGKIEGYYFGIIGTLFGSYLSFDLMLWGNFLLHFFYYFPMEIIGFFKWRSNFDKKTHSVIKTKLNRKEILPIIVATLLLLLFLYFIFIKTNNKSPFFDSAIVVFSALAMYLTVKRCFEQWFVWTMVNILSVMMWFDLFVKGEKIFSVFAVRIIYFILGIYFFYKWKKEQINL